MENVQTAKTYTLSKAQMNFYWKRLWYWLKYWRLDKSFQYFESTSYKEENYYAAVAISWNEGLCMLYLCAVWDKKPDYEAIDRNAFHESLHVLLSPMDTSTAEESSCGSEHAIIRTLENQVWTRISEYAKG